jgi:hypothetical protein
MEKVTKFKCEQCERQDVPMSPVHQELCAVCDLMHLEIEVEKVRRAAGQEESTSRLSRGHCEDYPACGHESGDCGGKLWGTDEQVKAAYLNKISDPNYDEYYDESGR